MKFLKKYALTLPIFILFTACAGNGSNADNRLSEEEQLKPEELKENIVKAEFTIDPESDTTVFGEKGTRIFVGSNAFQYPDGSTVNEPVTITLEEYYSKTEIALANLSTTSDGQILESGGMLYIAAEVNGQPVEIGKNKSLVVHFPADSYKKDGMELFYGGESTSESSVMDWSLDQTGNSLQRTLELGGYGWQYPAHDDTTEYDFQPKDFGEKDVYYWNPIDFYIKSFDWSESAIDEITTTMNKTKLFSSYDADAFDHWNTFGVECEMNISKDGYIKNVSINTPISRATREEVKRFLYNLPQLEPGKNKHGKIIERKGYMLIEEGRPVEIYEKRADYMKSFDEKYAEFEDEPITNMDKAELEYYIFNVTQMGWINCDRFRYLDREDKIDLFVDYEANEDVEFKLIFPKINSVIRADVKDGKYYFPNVVKDEWVTIFGMKTTNGKVETFFKEKLISDQSVKDVAFNETTLDALKKELDKL